jgi:hypothetical protein
MTFKEYYKHYLTLHQNKWNRRLHILGQLTTIATFIFITYLIIKVINLLFFHYIVLFPSSFIPFAWSGHFFLEKNKPASFKNPWWAKRSDWVMLKDILIGKIKL